MYLVNYKCAFSFTTMNHSRYLIYDVYHSTCSVKRSVRSHAIIQLWTCRATRATSTHSLHTNWCKSGIFDAKKDNRDQIQLQVRYILFPTTIFVQPFERRFIEDHFSAHSRIIAAFLPIMPSSCEWPFCPFGPCHPFTKVWKATSLALWISLDALSSIESSIFENLAQLFVLKE